MLHQKRTKTQNGGKPFAYEMLLVDALNDPTLSTSRRLLAGAVIGEGPDIDPNP